MPTLGQLLDGINADARALTATPPDSPTLARVVAGWADVAGGAARALLAVPTHEDPDAAARYRALLTLHQTPPTQTVTPASALTRIGTDYHQIAALLAGQPAAAGADTLHAETLRAHLCRPLNTLAEWTLHYGLPHLPPHTREALTDLATSTRHPHPAVPTGSRYTDLGGLVTDSPDPVLAHTAGWVTAARRSFDTPSTTTLRLTLIDFALTTSTAYYLIKATAATGHLPPPVATAAGQHLWDARQSWRAQARAWPTDLRAGPLHDPDRDAASARLRDTLHTAYLGPAKDWLPTADLLQRHHPDQLLQHARQLTTATAVAAVGFAAAVARLTTGRLQRRDPNYQPVFAVGTDLAKARRERWLTTLTADPELTQLALRALTGAALTKRALDAVQDTAFDRPRRPSETSQDARADLRKLIAVLDATIPPRPTRWGTPLDPTGRPQWADGHTPPQSHPDAPTPDPLRPRPDPQPRQPRPRPLTP